MKHFLLALFGFFAWTPITLASKPSFEINKKHYAQPVNSSQEKLTSAGIPCVTIPFQGIFASEVQFAKYIQGTIKTSTNELASCSRSLPLWTDVFIGTPLSDIRPLNTTSYKYSGDKSRFSIYPIMLPLLQIPQYCFDKATEVVIRRTYKQQGITFTKNPEKQDVASLNGHHVTIGQFNLGQDIDLAKHTERMAEAERMYPKTPKVITGVSRGAFTAFVAVAKNKHNNNYNNIRLVTLEGCGDNLSNLVDNRFWYIPTLGIDLRQKLYRLITTTFTHHKPDGISPLDVVNEFPHDIPVAFISSKIDTEVPFKNTENIVAALKKSGHPNIHFLVLNNSSHNGYMMDDSVDREKYLLFMKALYHTLRIQPELASFNSPEEYEKAMRILAESKVSTI